MESPSSRSFCSGECKAEVCPAAPVLQAAADYAAEHGSPPVLVLKGLDMAETGMRNHPDMVGDTDRIRGFMLEGLSDYPGVGSMTREEVLGFMAACIAVGCEPPVSAQRGGR